MTTPTELQTDDDILYPSKKTITLCAGESATFTLYARHETPEIILPVGITPYYRKFEKRRHG